MAGMKDSSKIGSIIIQEQVKALLRMAYSHKDNISALKNKLEEYKTPENKTFKVEAIVFAFEHMVKHPNKFPERLREVIHDLLSAKSATIGEDKKLLKTDGQNISTNASPTTTQEDYKTLSEYKKVNNTMPESLDLFMKRAIDDDDINEIVSLNHLNKSLGKRRITVDENPPLEYALKLGKNDLALKMMQAGFVINHWSKKIEQSSVNDAIQNIIQRRSGRNVVQDILNGTITDRPLRRSY